VSYFAVLAGLFMMRIEKSQVAHDGGSPIEKLREGFRFVRHAAPIRTLLLLLGVVSFMGLPFSVLVPIFADRILHGGVSAYGNLMGAVGLGAMFGALALAMRQELRGLGNIVSYSSIGLGVSLTLFGASRWYFVSLTALALAGFTMMMQFTSTNTLIQAMVPDQLRGRVMSLYSMMFLGMSPLGSLLAGAIADRVGAPITVVLGGVASLAGGVVFARNWPSMRAPARELVAAQGMMQPQPPPEATTPQR
jgi:MFS family permease